jgi:hypothetical protein
MIMNFLISGLVDVITFLNLLIPLSMIPLGSVHCTFLHWKLLFIITHNIFLKIESALNQKAEFVKIQYFLAKKKSGSAFDFQN